MGVHGWADLEPRFDWRRSQRHLLDVAGRVTDERWHLCAPPGAGKTLIGLELARRVGRPTLVLSPTTAIRDQRRASTAMFGAEPAEFSRTSVEAGVSLLSVTYQLLGNPGAASGELAAAARRLWVADVSVDAGDAEERVRAVQAHDPRRARRELLSRVRRIRRSLSSPDIDAAVAFEDLVGSRARELIDTLAGLQIGCVILDECHHLLDWWAFVTIALVDELAAHGDVAVIGLTATLPDPDSSREAENYVRLLGPVDAEMQLPAMVAEGGVVPWRDGVRLAAPTDGEAAFIDDHARHVTAELDVALVEEEFVSWAVARILGPAIDERSTAPATDTTPVAAPEAAAVTAVHWSSFWDRDPLAAAACAGWWESRGLALPAGFDPPANPGPFTLDDRLVLVDTWLHDPDRPCPPGSHDQLAALLRRYGYAITSTGVRATRSPADLVCARSTAKGDEAAVVIAGELTRRGDAIRALVVVERDRATTPPAAARRVLGEDAGTVGRALASLCAHADVLEAGVVAVTGRGMWVDAVSCDAAMAEISVAVGPQRWVTSAGADIAGAVRLIGEGAGWSTARWLAAAEHVLEEGLVHTLIATRGLVGEGWDCPALNVLVDCSEAASRTAVTQLRGRALRCSAGEPGKVASIWDVAVVHEGAPGDWNRLRRRHEGWWGRVTALSYAVPARCTPVSKTPLPRHLRRWRSSTPTRWRRSRTLPRRSRPGTTSILLVTPHLPWSCGRGGGVASGCAPSRGGRARALPPVSLARRRWRRPSCPRRSSSSCSPRAHWRQG